MFSVGDSAEGADLIAAKEDHASKSWGSLPALGIVGLFLCSTVVVVMRKAFKRRNQSRENGFELLSLQEEEERMTDGYASGPLD
jgi:hypothetical protein